MALTLILAAFLSSVPTAAAEARPTADAIDRSKSDSDRLTDLYIDVQSAHRNGEIDNATAREFYLGIGRIRRQLIVMGIQVGYRQRVRMRARIDRLHARFEQRRLLQASQVRSEK